MHWYDKIDWAGILKKGWIGLLTLAAAYAVYRSDQWGWAAPVLTAWAGMTRPAPEKGA